MPSLLFHFIRLLHQCSNLIVDFLLELWRTATLHRSRPWERDGHATARQFPFPTRCYVMIGCLTIGHQPTNTALGDSGSLCPCDEDYRCRYGRVFDGFKVQLASEHSEVLGNIKKRKGFRLNSRYVSNNGQVAHKHDSKSKKMGIPTSTTRFLIS